MKFKERLSLCWRILRLKSGNLLSHAEFEFDNLGQDEMQLEMNQNLRELILVFSTQGHSGFSASYARRVLNKLLAYEPLTPLSGKTIEWVEVGDGLYQNRRCGSVFKDKNRYNGQAYNIDGKVFVEPNSVCFTSKDSIVLIEFPYTPVTEYVHVEASD